MMEKVSEEPECEQAEERAAISSVKECLHKGWPRNVRVSCTRGLVDACLSKGKHTVVNTFLSKVTSQIKGQSGSPYSILVENL